VPALDLGQGLRVEIEVVERHAALARDEGTAFFPPRLDGDEVIGRRKIDVQLQALFQPRNRAQDGILIRHDADVHVDGARAPAFQDGSGATSEIDARVGPARVAERSHEAADALDVG